MTSSVHVRRPVAGPSQYCLFISGSDRRDLKPLRTRGRRDVRLGVRIHPLDHPLSTTGGQYRLTGSTLSRYYQPAGRKGEGIKKDSAGERGRRWPDVDVPTLLGDDRESFEAVLSGEGAGPVAVVGDPFSGRGAVLDRAVRNLDATRVSLDPVDGVDRPERVSPRPILELITLQAGLDARSS